MRDIFIRHDGAEFYTKTSNYSSPNSWALARHDWRPTPDERFWRTADPASVLRVVLHDRYGQLRATAEAVAIVEAARDALPDDLRHVVLRATTSENEIAAKAMKKEAAAAAKAAKERAREVGILAHLDGADAGMIGAAYEALRILAAKDQDFATKRNGRGFGHPDAKDGHRLAASAPGASRLDDARALEIARRYRGQLQPHLGHTLGVWTTAQAAAVAESGDRA
ncbi:hypothetical protein [Aureimonas sp. N4]|uniref:hypothetical protein n=1 Tax=Aureimonas sp. N4 TaxID=1638165 RepID=UPI000780469D|nr:hypothetical protein [Aureimonas sp. N4]